MSFRIGLIGVPIETVPLIDTGIAICFHIPGITDDARQAILRRVWEKKFCIDDLGELDIGEAYNPGFRIDRLEGIPAEYYGLLKQRDMKKLEQAREFVLKKSREYDLMIATGPSHLGAITLYDKGDRVARMDYHADFSELEQKQVYFSYANYLSWVKANIKDLALINYFVKPDPGQVVFGDLGDSAEECPFAANHFDIDFDCFDTRYRIQNIYPHHNGDSGATPEFVLSMIEKAKPSKLGLWEYRPRADYDNNGLEFIVNAISAVAGKQPF